jgi:hypothetical protein
MKLTQYIERARPSRRQTDEPERDDTMKPAIITYAALLSVVLSAQAYGNVGNDGTRPASGDAVTIAAVQQHPKKSSQPRKSVTPQSSAVVIYNHDSKDPNIGWHWEGGMRTCHQDCDNPEIPGSGYTCRNVQVFGMAMRECDSSN